MPSFYNLKNQANAVAAGSRDPAVKELAKVVHELCKLVEEGSGKSAYSGQLLQGPSRHVPPAV